MTASAVIDAHVLHGRADTVAELVDQLVESALPKLGHYRDLPQIGAVATAVGTYLLTIDGGSDPGLELFALAPKVFPRQDYPSMHWQRHREFHQPAVGAERMAAAVRAAVPFNRRTAPPRIFELLNEFRRNR